MNNSTFRIKTSINQDKHIKVQLEQKYDIIEILSIKLSQEEIYNSNTSDFGVVVGRVESSGVGIPNVKVSIFIPLSETDESNPIIKTLYPFKTPSDKDQKGKRYNLLPKIKENVFYNNLITGGTESNPIILNDGFDVNEYGLGYKPDTPLGSFYIKDELVTNEIYVEIFEKYYKYTATTNDSGDYCIMGVPLGTYTIFMDCDLTDIGKYSMKPIVLSKLLGYPNGQFTKNGTKIKKINDLDKALHLQYQEKSIDVIPIWGLKEVNDEIREIGITRCDFSIQAEIRPIVTIFSTGFTMPKNAYWYDFVIFRLKIGTLFLNVPAFGFDFSSNPCSINGGKYDISPFHIEASTKRLGYFMRFNLNADDFRGSETTITDKLSLARHRNGEFEIQVIDHFDVNNPIIKDDSEYISVLGNGFFVLMIPCNKNFMITNEQGQLVPSPNNNTGLPMSFDGSIIAKMKGEIDNPPAKVTSDRIWFKIPQSINYYDNPTNWINNHHSFSGNTIYSIAQKWYGKQSNAITNGNLERFDSVGALNEIILDTNNELGIDFQDNAITYNAINDKWVNFCLYFLQYGSKRGNNPVCTDIIDGRDRTFNTNPIATGLFNTQSLARGDHFQTKFIQVPRTDIIKFLSECNKSRYTLDNLLGNQYMDINGNNTRNNFIFYKGLNEVNIFNYLLENNII